MMTKIGGQQWKIPYPRWSRPACANAMNIGSWWKPGPLLVGLSDGKHVRGKQQNISMLPSNDTTST